MLFYIVRYNKIQNYANQSSQTDATYRDVSDGQFCSTDAGCKDKRSYNKVTRIAKVNLVLHECINSD